MKTKLNKILITVLVLTLVTIFAVTSGFNFKSAKIDNSFAENSTYRIETAGNTAIMQNDVSIKASDIDADIMLTKILDNIEKETESISEEYKAEVLGNAATGEATVVAAAPLEAANLNDSEAAILNLINTIRVSNGLGILQADQKLTDIARYRCSDMITNSYFSHYTPDGRNIFNILGENGVPYVNGGENLGQSNPASSGSPEAFANAWMASPTHKANIVRSVYSKIGIGVVDGGGRRVVATVFTN